MTCFRKQTVCQCRDGYWAKPNGVCLISLGSNIQQWPRISCRNVQKQLCWCIVKKKKKRQTGAFFRCSLKLPCKNQPALARLSSSNQVLARSSTCGSFIKHNAREENPKMLSTDTERTMPAFEVVICCCFYFTWWWCLYTHTCVFVVANYYTCTLYICGKRWFVLVNIFVMVNVTLLIVQWCPAGITLWGHCSWQVRTTTMAPNPVNRL